MNSQDSLFPDKYSNEMGIVKEFDSAYAKVYWIVRALINTENGGIGGDSKVVLQLLQTANVALTAESFDLTAAKTGLYQYIRSIYATQSKAAGKVENLIEELEGLIEAPIDFMVLRFTLEHVLIPMNFFIRQVPSNDRAIAETMMRAYLETQGAAGLSNVIGMWDKIGRRGSMEAERIAVVAGFRILRKTLDEMIADGKIQHLDSDQALTAFVQEFERRLSRGVRPARAGRSLEDVTGVILEHFNVENYTDAPEHIKTAFEVDKLITLPDGWRIGVSCKRTLRERWKQAATLDIQRLDSYKIKSTWHVITYPGDLSKPKVAAIGESRGVVYVPDESHFYHTYSQDPEISRFLRPMSRFIDDLKDAAQ